MRSLNRLERAMFLIVALCVGSVAGGWTRRAPVPGLTLSELTERADVIATGTVTRIDTVGRATLSLPSGPAPASMQIAELTVDQFLKGGGSATTLPVQFVVGDAPWTIRPVVVGQYRIFFLTSSSAGVKFVSSSQASLPAVPGGGFDSASSLLDNVIRKMGAVLQSPSAAREAKEDVLIMLASDRNPAARASTIAALRTGLSEADPSLRYRAAAMLLHANDVAAVPVAEAALTHPEAVRAEYLVWFRSAISADFSDAAAIPFLTRLIRLDDVETRRAAARALSRTQSPSAAPALAQALTDSDAEVSFWAVVGLRDLTGQGWGLNRDAFEARRAEQIAQWTAWARARGLIK